MLRGTAILVGLVSSSAAIAAEPFFPFFEPVQPPRRVQIMAHRGLQAVASENTAEAVLACGFEFIEWAEVDVRRTKDGRHVILHDAMLDRTTSGTGPVREITAEDFVALDAGAWYGNRFKGRRPLTLAELLKLARGKVNLTLDCKDVEPALLVGEILAAKMERQVIVFAGLEVLAEVRRIGEDRVPVMAKFRPAMTEFETFANAVRPAAVEIDANEVSADLCRLFHEHGIRVQAKVLGAEWDRSEVWRKVIAAGVDWLQTDNPAGVRFSEVRDRLGKLPVGIAFHRGASRYAPENTLPAIDTAAALGADYIEIDIRTTSDGKFVLLHDGSLDRTTSARGPVATRTGDEVEALDAGSWFSSRFAGTKVPSFDAGLTAMGDRSAAYLDAKQIAPEALIAAIRKHNLLERSAVYQSREYLAKLRALEPAVRTMPPLGGPGDLDAVAAEKPYAVDARWAALTPELIQRCHAAGIRVFSDALGPFELVEQYREKIGWGIDVIQTDHPLRVLRAAELTESVKAVP